MPIAPYSFRLCIPKTPSAVLVYTDGERSGWSGGVLNRARRPKLLERCISSNQRGASPIGCVCREVPGFRTTALSGGPRVAMVQSADLRDGDYRFIGRWLDSTRHGSVAFKREMEA